MPFKSRAQAAKCYAADDPSWDCAEWAKKTNFKKLPAKAPADKTAGALVSLSPTTPPLPSPRIFLAALLRDKSQAAAPADTVLDAAALGDAAKQAGGLAAGLREGAEHAAPGFFKRMVAPAIEKAAPAVLKRGLPTALSAAGGAAEGYDLGGTPGALVGGGLGAAAAALSPAQSTRTLGRNAERFVINPARRAMIGAGVGSALDATGNAFGYDSPVPLRRVGMGIGAASAATQAVRPGGVAGMPNWLDRQMESFGHGAIQGTAAPLQRAGQLFGASAGPSAATGYANQAGRVVGGLGMVGLVGGRAMQAGADKIHQVAHREVEDFKDVALPAIQDQVQQNFGHFADDFIASRLGGLDLLNERGQLDPVRPYARSFHELTEPIRQFFGGRPGAAPGGYPGWLPYTPPSSGGYDPAAFQAALQQLRPGDGSPAS